ncbi:hypothetical protein B0T13DRAFT_117941 [Neurospora crassa]|nr:hypothetical protein B0T13DRAFT_117941 [Neurospora crassa]
MTTTPPAKNMIRPSQHPNKATRCTTTSTKLSRNRAHRSSSRHMLDQKLRDRAAHEEHGKGLFFLRPSLSQDYTGFDSLTIAFKAHLEPSVYQLNGQVAVSGANSVMDLSLCKVRSIHSASRLDAGIPVTYVHSYTELNLARNRLDGDTSAHIWSAREMFPQRLRPSDHWTMVVDAPLRTFRRLSFVRPRPRLRPCLFPSPQFKTHPAMVSRLTPHPVCNFPDGHSKGHHVACGPSTDFAAPETCCATIDHFGVHDGAHVLDAHYLVKHDISTLSFVPRSTLSLHRLEVTHSNALTSSRRLFSCSASR